MTWLSHGTGRISHGTETSSLKKQGQLLLCHSHFMSEKKFGCKKLVWSEIVLGREKFRVGKIFG